MTVDRLNMISTMTRVLFLAGLGGLMLAAPSAAQCGPDGDIQFVCGPVSPEDLVPVPDAPWVLAAGMEDDGYLYAIDTRTHGSSVLFPTATYGSRPDAIYSESGLGPSPPGQDNFLGGLPEQPQPLGGGGWVDLHFDGDLTAGGPGDRSPGF